MSVAEPRLPRTAPAPETSATPAALRGRLLPVGLVALALALVLGFVLARDHGNLTAPVCFGSQFAASTHPPSGAALCGREGYDGQFFDVLAHDPLLLHSRTLQAMRASGELFRIQRLGYPLAAWLLSAGRPAAIAAALLAVNVLVLLTLTGWLTGWLARRGRSPLWATAVALMPGMLLPVLRDLSDPLATAGVIVGVLAWQERRRTLAALALSVAVLTREVLIAVVLALAAEAALRAWQARGSATPGAARRALAEAAAALGVPALLFAAWQGYVTIRAGGPLGTSPATLPFVNVIQEARSTIRLQPPGIAGWELVYLALLIGAVALAVRELWRGVTVSGAAAAALCVSVVVPVFGDYWSDTRLSAPLFALLLLDGLARRDRRCVALGTVATMMTLFILPAL